MLPQVPKQIHGCLDSAKGPQDRGCSLCVLDRRGQEPAKSFQVEYAEGKPDPRQGEISWSGFKMCAKYSLTGVI